MNMNLQKYLALLKAVEYGSFTKAAAELKCSQSGISRMIGDLERDWGLSLLARGRGGVQLTAEGQKLLPHVQAVLQQCQRLQTEVDELNGLQSGLLRIGTFSSVATHWLPNIIREFQIDAKSVRRKKYEVVYLKEGSGIVDLLNVMGAHVSLMNLENLRIVKEMRNSVNRRVNCETANISKTVTAASKQIEDILLIRDKYGFDNLPDNLRQMAEVRLEYPDAALKELGGYLDPAVGKSGVNHRLRKLSEIADRIRL